MRRKGEINHGTSAGYKNHKWRKEQACLECRVAWREYYRGLRAAKQFIEGINGTTSN